MKLSISGYDILVMEPEEEKRCPVIYLHTNNADVAEDIWNRMKEKNFTLACIWNVDWNREMTPWPAPSVYKHGDDFSGKAEEYLELLTAKIVPEVEMKLNCLPAGRGVIGYSLSGLFALYALYKTDAFNLIGSMSGSMWFDGWTEYMQNNVPKAASPKVYLSLGDKEKKTGNARMAAVESCTRQAAEILERQGAEVLFEMNAGNHFVDVPGRIAKGIRWLVAGQAK